jgi:hypothetical protein
MTNAAIQNTALTSVPSRYCSVLLISSFNPVSSGRWAGIQQRARLDSLPHQILTRSADLKGSPDPKKIVRGSKFIKNATRNQLPCRSLPTWIPFHVIHLSWILNVIAQVRHKNRVCLSASRGGQLEVRNAAFFITRPLYFPSSDSKIRLRSRTLAQSPEIIQMSPMGYNIVPCHFYLIIWVFRYSVHLLHHRDMTFTSHFPEDN